MADRDNGARRRRSSSILQVYHEPPETLEQISDQAALPNLNANWTNAKGNSLLVLPPPASDRSWTIHIVLIACLKIFYDVIPGVSQETSWTLTNMTYMFGSYLMFHYVRGVPFEFNSGAFDNLNMWEQIDNGAQYTPTKKFLLSVPIVLFLLSTHYTHYDLAYFIINFLAVLGVIIPKLPFVATVCDSVYSLASLRSEWPGGACSRRTCGGDLQNPHKSRHGSNKLNGGRRHGAERRSQGNSSQGGYIP
ncbi:protein ORM1 [Purpureocillium lilacinum]|uniref:Protein ORM1 n=1 Tax=Purpureocillium lilacinum TaxID=33203 RepID=A0A179GCI1_PURLI|nr:protein ORM1 [Purpureocillium lilacinum]